jgi:hypothetical protein
VISATFPSSRPPGLPAITDSRYRKSPIILHARIGQEVFANLDGRASPGAPDHPLV